MKIVQVIPSIDDQNGGPSIGAKALHMAVQELGGSNLLLSRAATSGEASEVWTDREHVALCRPSFPVRLSGSWPMLRRLWRESIDTDLIHIHGQYLLPCVYAYAVARLRHIPYGIQAHGGLEPYQRAQSRGRKAIYNMIIGRRIIRRAKYVHFSDESEADRASDVVRDSQKLIVPLGASLEEPELDPGLARQVGRVPRERMVLFLGRLAKKKNPDMLLKAWANVPSSIGGVLVVAGGDDFWSVRQLEEMARRLGVSERTVFVGPVIGGRKSWLFERAGVFVLPSDNENFALSVVEAMSSGCFVVTTEGVASSRYVLAADAGVVLPRPEEMALAASLVQALMNPSGTHAAGMRGAELVDAELSWKKLASALRTLSGAEA